MVKLFNIIRLSCFPFLLFFIITPSQDLDSYKWKSVESADHSDLKNIFISNNKSLIFGKNISILKNKQWQLLENIPPIEIRRSFANANSNIWISNFTKYYDSDLYHYNDEKWVQVSHPLANQIDVMYFDDNNNGVIGGFGELAFYKNEKWFFESLPFAGVIINLILDKDNILWVVENSSTLWKFQQNEWTNCFPNLKIKNIFEAKDSTVYALTDTSVYFYQNKEWKLHSHSEILKNISSFSILDNSNIWGCGQYGLIVNFQNNKWSQIQSPTDENLNKIVMNDNGGWIVGNNGTILNYNNNNSFFKPYKLGFNKHYIYSDSKIIDDQYGVVINDFTNDGLPEIVALSIFENTHYYVNKGSSFIESSRLFGLGKTESEDLRHYNTQNLAASAGDIDNDGDTDLFITSLNDYNIIYDNYDNGYFRKLNNSNITGIKSDRSNSTSISDIDNDGDLDIFVTNENTTNKLYLNNGQGFFTDITATVNLETDRGGTGCTLTDIDNDNDIDIIVVNWAKSNTLFKNMLSETNKLNFVNATESSGIGGFPYTKSNGVISFDADNDGDLDLFITNRKTSNRYYLNNGHGIFTDVTKDYIGIDSLASYGVVAADFDNDGDKDLYISNVGENKFYQNNGMGKFMEKTNRYLLEMDGYSTGSATGDIDNDGDIDIYVANYTGGTSSLLFINKLNDTNYIKIKVIGTISNRSGIGAKVYIYDAGYSKNNDHLLSFNEVQSGSGYGSCNDFIFHTGIRNAKNVDVVVYFPSSKKERILKNINVGSSIEVYEEIGFSGKYSIIKRDILNLLLNSNVHHELLKYLIVFIGMIIVFKTAYKKFNYKLAYYLILFVSISIFYWLHIYFFQHSSIILSSILPISGVFFILILIFLYLQKNHIENRAIIEKRITRESISRDLHDEVASTLSSISIYNETLKRIINTDNQKANRIFSKINNLIIEAAESVTNIVWSVTPDHDSLESLTTRLKLLLDEIRLQNNIKYDINVNVETNSLLLTGSIRHNVYMIFKEAIHNILKHSKATHIIVGVTQNSNTINFEIIDNGIGINTDKSPTKKNLLNGNGLKNMGKRAEQINAKLLVESKNPNGTKITLIIKMT